MKLLQESTTRLGVASGLRMMFLIKAKTQKLAMLGDLTCADAAIERPAEYLRVMVLALIVELTEFLQLFDWKPWRHRKGAASKDEMLEEFADILAFVGGLIYFLASIGYSADMIAEAYVRKEEKNVSRFIEKFEAGKNGN
jgi:NTP pyrophosphatase (non-canonical NTP hydrolase)